MKNPIFTLFIILLLVGATVWWFQSPQDGQETQANNAAAEKPIIAAKQDKQLKIEPSTAIETPIETQPAKSQAKEQAADIRQESLKTYNDLFQIAGLNNGFMADVEPGDPINVTNFHDANIAPSIFSPLYSNGKIVAISIFREFIPGKRELARMRNVTEDWLTYPPIDEAQAQHSLLSQYPNLAFNNIPGYYYLEDRETPFYLYENDMGAEKKYYLVSALNSQDIQIKEQRGYTSQEENIPVKLNASGLIEIDEMKVADLSEDQLEQLRKEIEVTNQYIQDGIMKFDEDMNLIFDKR